MIQIIILSIVALAALIVVIYLRKTFTFMNRARFRNAVVIILALFFLLSTIIILIHKSWPEKYRISVIPVLSLPLETQDAWLNWAIADDANKTLKHYFKSDTLVYPLDWIWSSIDKDSVQYEDYVKAYIERVELDHAILTRLELTDTTTTLEFVDVHVKDKNSTRQSILLNSGNRLMLADTIVNYIFKRFEHPLIKRQEKQPEAFYKLKSRAQVACLERNYKQAISLAERAKDIDSTRVDLLNLLAKVNLRYGVKLDDEGKPGKLNQLVALRICENILTQIDTTHAETYRLVGKYYLLQEIWSKAEKYLKQAYQLDSQNALIYLDYAHFHDSRIKKLGFKDEEDILKYAIYLNPCSEEIKLYLADYYYFNLLNSHARRVVHKLLEIHPRSVQGLMFLGKMAVAQSDLQAIVDIYTEILKIDPDNTDAYYNLGVYYFNSGDYKNAQRFFQRAIDIGNHIDSHLYLGIIFENQGKIQQAKKQYRLRIRYKKGFDDPYVDQARKRLFTLTNPDSSQLEINIKP